jgi:GNAT superfamily N-acetyltransferase
MELAPYHLRRATADDAAVVARHRVAMFCDMGQLGAHEIEPLRDASQRALRAALADGGYLGWLIERAARVVAGGGLILRPLLPRPGALHGGSEAYVLNVYTEPAERRRGLARHLMQTMLTWCDAQGVARIALHASDDGRPLYCQLGFAPTNELRRGA